MQHVPTICKSLCGLFLAASLVLSGGVAVAAEIHVMTSGGFTAAYNVLVPEFERTTGHKVITAYGASMGNAPDAIPSRLALRLTTTSDICLTAVWGSTHQRALISRPARW